MTDHASIIAELEAEGYQVYPPRDVQSEWEMDVGRFLSSAQGILNALDAGKVSVSDDKRWTLEFIAERIVSVVERAQQKKSAA